MGSQGWRGNDRRGPQMTNPNYAPGPYSTVDIGVSHTAFHSYIVDANGRKIGVAWGPVTEKVWTAALWAGSLDTLASLKETLELVESAWGDHFNPNDPPCGELCAANDCQRMGCITDKIRRARAAIEKIECAHSSGERTP